MKEPEPSRRGFLARVVVALNALVALVVATPAAGYLLSPLLRRRSSQWVAIGRASMFAAGIPQRVTYEYDDEAGYSVEQTRRVAFVGRSEDELIVLSPVCTHMGCNVAFNEAASLPGSGRSDARGHPTPSRLPGRVPSRTGSDYPWNVDEELRTVGGRTSGTGGVSPITAIVVFSL